MAENTDIKKTPLRSNPIQPVDHPPLVFSLFPWLRKTAATHIPSPAIG
jgi:hypothetical protein